MSAGRVVCGIDEAGLGPLLGPLTFGYSAFHIPTSGGDLWERLAAEVAPAARGAGDRVVVADSKKVYARNPRGRERLETTALGFLAQLDGGRPMCGADLLRTPPAELRPRAAHIKAHPWYGELAEELPAWMPADRLAIRAAKLRRGLDQASIRLLDAGVRVVPELELNRSFEETGNKGLSVMSFVFQILQHLWRSFGEDEVRVVVDRQGGRWHYGRVLHEAFPGTALKVLSESPAMSQYVIEEQEGGRRMLVTFAERGEERAFSVALASCIAKYTRELCMQAFNAFFQDLQPELHPTAGYTQDGRRWLEEAAPALAQADLPARTLIRER
ncbi:MAG: hypothetical protein MK297_13115 [Planctomycetes bacterium]|nr:hypothetical protein [Planctomycetota bacterium]